MKGIGKESTNKQMRKDPVTRSGEREPPDERRHEASNNKRWQCGSALTLGGNDWLKGTEEILYNELAGVFFWLERARKDAS